MRLALGSKEIELELECKGHQNVTLFWMLLEVSVSPKKKYGKNENVNVQVFISWHLIF